MSNSEWWTRQRRLNDLFAALAQRGTLDAPSANYDNSSASSAKAGEGSTSAYKRSATAQIREFVSARSIRKNLYEQATGETQPTILLEEFDSYISSSNSILDIMESQSGSVPIDLQLKAVHIMRVIDQAAATGHFYFSSFRGPYYEPEPYVEGPRLSVWSGGAPGSGKRA